MKSLLLSLSLIVLLSLGANANFSNDPDARITSKTKVINKVKLKVDYPQFAIDQNIKGDVHVSFTLNADGTINIKEIHSTEELLKEFVKAELLKITLKKDWIYPDETYVMRFKFNN